jgi:hypothetical protein
LEDFIEILEKGLSFGSIRLFDIFLVDLYDKGEAIDDKLFEEGAVVDGISGWLNVDCL